MEHRSMATPAQEDGPTEAYTVSKMLSSFNAVMAPVATDSTVSVSLKRKADNGVMLDTSAKEIAYLDMCAKVKHSAQRAATLSRSDKAKYVDEQRERGNAAFKRREFAQAADLYVQALAALDFGTTPAEREQCQLHAQLPLTCNLAACMLMMEQWTKARQMCDEALRIKPTYVKALQQRARACTRLSAFEQARDDVRTAIAAARLSASPTESESALSRLEKQLLDIDRAETRHKQQLLQQRRFHAKMMREGVGQLYRDKRAVAASDAHTLEPSVARDASGSTRVISWTSTVLRTLLQLIVAVLTALVQSLRRTKAKEM